MEYDEYYYSDYEEEEEVYPDDPFIRENRKVKLLRDVDSLVPDELKKLLSLIDEIIETNNETLETILKKIEESGQPINSIYSIIEYALKIRPLATESLLSLHSALAQKHGCKNSHLNNYMNENDFDESEMMLIIKQDDVDTFIKMCREGRINPNSRVSYDLDSQLGFVKFGMKTYDGYEEDYDDHKLSYFQIMAFYGAIKCFKYAIQNYEPDLYSIEEYAIAGGNKEIISILEQHDISFDGCFGVSIMFHRNELSDEILEGYECYKLELSKSCAFFNYRAAIFGFMNKITVNNALSLAAGNGHLEVVKYLHETCHVNKSDWAISNASLNGHLEVVKYLHETVHAEVDEDAISNASANGHLDVVKYLYETCHAYVDDEAIINGHLDVVKYLHETCHAKISPAAIITASLCGSLDLVKYLVETCHVEVPENAIDLALGNGHLEVVKYLYETCHAKVPDNAMGVAIAKGFLDVVKYLYETCHSKIPDIAIEYASISSKLEVVKYLHETCHAKITETAIINARKYGCFDIAKYFEKQH